MYESLVIHWSVKMGLPDSTRFQLESSFNSFQWITENHLTKERNVSYQLNGGLERKTISQFKMIYY